MIQSNCAIQWGRDWEKRSGRGRNMCKSPAVEKNKRKSVVLRENVAEKERGAT